VRIGIDCTSWGNRRGYGRFTRSLVNALLEIDPANQYILFFDGGGGGGYPVPSEGRQVVVKTAALQAKAASAYGHRSLADMCRMSMAAACQKLDVFFSPTVFGYFPLFGHFRKVVTIHDAIATLHPGLIFPTRSGQVRWRLKVWLALRQADRVVTVSKHARHDISRCFGLSEETIAIIPDCASDIFRPPEVRSHAQALVMQSYGVATPYVLYVGGFGPHKNVAGLIDSFAMMADLPEFSALSLVLVGERVAETFYSTAAALDGLVGSHNLSGRIHFLGFRPDDELATLYQGAEVLVLPSFREGFGLPGIEAAACGTPIIATRESPLGEVLGDAVRLIDPTGPGELLAAMKAVVGDPDKLSRMREAALRNRTPNGWQSAAAHAVLIFADKAVQPKATDTTIRSKS
jgi:glycosyltransferase involved in cell wall biosynthesis